MYIIEPKPLRVFLFFTVAATFFYGTRVAIKLHYKFKNNTTLEGIDASKSENKKEIKIYRDEDAHQTIEVIKSLYPTFCKVGKETSIIDNCYDDSSSYMEYSSCLQTSINKQKALILALDNKDYMATEVCSKKLETIILKNINGRLKYSIRQLEWLELNESKLDKNVSIRKSIRDCIEKHNCSNLHISYYRDTSDFSGDNNPNGEKCTINLFKCHDDYNICYPSKVASYLGVGCSESPPQKGLYYKYNNESIY
jgi:hypothetical protein